MMSLGILNRNTNMIVDSLSIKIRSSNYSLGQEAHVLTDSESEPRS